MSRAFPDLPILALVDWYGCPFLRVTLQFLTFRVLSFEVLDIYWRNPAGLAILCTFKFGSIGMGLEAYRYGNLVPVYLLLNNNLFLRRKKLTRSIGLWRVLACNVKWLGLRGEDLELIPEQALVPLKPKDLQFAKSFISSEILQVNCLSCIS